MKVAIVEDDPRYRESLCTVLEYSEGFEVVATFDDPRLAIEALAQAPQWDLVLMDVELPGMTGIEATRAIKRAGHEPVIIMLTVFEDPHTVLEAICAGADGYLLKRSTATEIVDELRHIGRGGAPLTACVAKGILDVIRSIAPSSHLAGASRPDPGLSPREEQVLRGLVEGRSYKQVASDLQISIDTVRGHIRRLYRKLQVHSVAEAVTRALRERLV